MKKKTIPTPARDSWNWRRAAPFAALWALTLVAYANSFQSGLIYDNAQIILKDPRVHAVSSENLRLILDKEYWYPTLGNGLYRPLTTLSYLFNYALLGNGGDPVGYHWVNYVIHSVNASLVFLLGVSLFAETLPAFAMAAIWAVHPVLTECVTNVVGRADLLAGFGVLAALLFFARRRFVAAFVAAAIGIFSKESAIVVIGAVLLYDLAFSKPGPWRERWRGYAAVALPCLLFLAARHFVLGASPAMHVSYLDNPLVDAGFWSAKLTAISVIGREMALLVWPARLSADYSYNVIPLVNGLDGAVLGGFVVLLAASALAVWGYRRDRKIFFLILFGLGALLPTSNLIFPLGAVMAERFLYLPAVAFAGCLAAVLWLLRDRIPAAAVRAACAVIVLLFAIRTFARNSDWFTEETLYSSMEAAVPASFRAHTNMAIFDEAAGKGNDAVRAADRALEILGPLPDDRNVPGPLITIGKAYSDKADSLPAGQGEPWRKKALDTLRRAERVADAVDQKNRQDDQAHGKIFHPFDRNLLYEHLGYVELRSQNFEDAAAMTEKSLHWGLTPEAFINLATAYIGKNDPRSAEIAILEGTIWRHTDNAIATYLVKVFRTTAPDSCALTVSGNSYHLNAACPLVQGELCEASARLIPLLEAQGQSAEAARVRTGAQHAGCPQ